MSLTSRPYQQLRSHGRSELYRQPFFQAARSLRSLADPPRGIDSDLVIEFNVRYGFPSPSTGRRPTAPPLLPLSMRSIQFVLLSPIDLIDRHDRAAAVACGLSNDRCRQITPSMRVFKPLANELCFARSLAPVPLPGAVLLNHRCCRCRCGLFRSRPCQQLRSYGRSELYR